MVLIYSCYYSASHWYPGLLLQELQQEVPRAKGVGSSSEEVQQLGDLGEQQRLSQEDAPLTASLNSQTATEEVHLALQQPSQQQEQGVEEQQPTDAAA